MQRSLISLGWRCDTAFELRMHGAENVAHFFDWLVTPMEGLFRILENDFNVFYPEDLVLCKEHPHPSYVKDMPTGVIFHHQFPVYMSDMQPDFLLHYPVFIKKFKYLAERFRAYMRERPITLVRQNISESEAHKLEEIIARLYPQSDVKFLYVNQGGDVFETPMGRSYIVKQEGSLGIPAEWVKVLEAESLINEPYRHSTLDIFGSLQHDYNLDTDHRFTDEQLREAIKFNPNKTEFRLELARWYAIRGMWEQAENEALLAVIENQDSVEAKCAAIQAQLRCGRIDARQAAADLSLIVEKVRPQEEWLYELSRYCLEAGELDKALAYIRKGLEIAPTKLNSYLLLADILWQQYRFNELQRPLELYQKVTPLPAFYEHFLAHAYEANGNLEAALAAEDRCLAHGLRYDALYLKSGILLKLGRCKEALEVCELARPLSGDYAKSLEDRVLELKRILGFEEPLQSGDFSSNIFNADDRAELVYEGTFSKNRADLLTFSTVFFVGDYANLILQARSLRLYGQDTIKHWLLVLNDEIEQKERKRLFESLQNEMQGSSFDVFLVDRKKLVDIDFIKVGGYRSQQILKIAVSNIIDDEFFVVLDAKNHAIRPLRKEFFVSDGLPVVHSVPYYTGFPFTIWFAKAFELMGLEPNIEVFRRYQSTTPYVLKTEVVKACMDQRPSLLGMPWHYYVGLPGDHKDSITEFGLYAAVSELLNNKTTIKPKQYHTLFAMAGANPDETHNYIKSMDDEYIKFFGVHRGISGLNSGTVDLLKQKWVEHGLFSSVASAQTFLSEGLYEDLSLVK